MSVSDLLLYASVAFYPLFLVAERLAPAMPQPAIKGWSIVGMLFLALYLAVGVFLPLALPDAWYAHSWLPGAGLGVAGGTVAGYLATTFVGYWWHRAVHRFPWLWRGFHQVHHSPCRLDVSGAFVFHPTEMAAYTLMAVFVTTIVLGLDPVASSLVGLLGMFNAVFQHADIRTPSWLGYLVQRPEAHRVHHGRDVHAFNYADFPVWDLLFGTFRAPHRVAEIGFDPRQSGRWFAMATFRDVHAPEFR
jgi:sterol desaturase/sphingolipid hydroxylase (fatty acid hydroxylase superfamily)